MENHSKKSSQFHINSYIDCIFAIIPKIQPSAPTAGPATLKACLEKNGYKSEVVDWNIDLYNRIKDTHSSIWFDDDTIFRNQDAFEEFYISNNIQDIVDEWCEYIHNRNAKWLGLSIFSQRSRFFSIKICQTMRKRYHDIKIVIGGANVIYSYSFFKRQNLCDAYIIGDGEDAIIDLMEGKEEKQSYNTYVINKVKDWNTVPVPDYSDIDFDQYDTDFFGNKNIAYVTSSRGCIRNCTFCDVEKQWPSYYFRDASLVADEIKSLYENHGVDTIHMTDSLINGSMSNFRKLCSLLKEYNLPVTVEGQFICRNKRQMPESDFTLMKEAKVNTVYIGIESGSQKVRDDMKKGFNEEDIWYTLDQLSKNKMSISIMLIIGYITETREDFEQTKQFVKKLKDLGYVDDGTVQHISLGSTMQIFEGTPIFEHKEEMGIEFQDAMNWSFKDNNLRERLERIFELRDFMEEYKISYKGQTKYRLASLQKKLDELRKNDL